MTKKNILSLVHQFVCKRFINDVAVMLADEIHSKLENPYKELNFKSLTYFVKPGQISEPSQVGLSIQSSWM